ncbi:unnamed protein product, partial [Rotaria magnacalcarata]
MIEFPLQILHALCQDGFSGQNCEQKEIRIDISFSDVSIPQARLVDFIIVRKYGARSMSPVPIRATIFKNIRFDEDIVTFFMSLPFHLAFAQIQSKFYLTVLQHNYTPSEIILAEIVPSQYCPHILNLFNTSIS